MPKPMPYWDEETSTRGLYPYPLDPHATTPPRIATICTILQRAE